jgi:sugar lactone lactonase YvrE
MFKISLTRPSQKKLLRGLILHTISLGVAALLALAAPSAQAQSVPVPFANTLAGGGIVCASGIPVYAYTGTGTKYGDGCPATQSVINTPVAVATDSYGNVFIADQNDDLVRVVYNGGTALANAIVAANVQATALVPQKGYIYTIAGGVTAEPSSTATYYCNESGTGPTALNRQLDGCPGAQTYQQPRGLAVDVDGNVFIANVGGTSSLRVFYVSGSAVTKLIALANPSITAPKIGYTYNIAGTAASSYTGNNVLASTATMNTPRGLIVDSAEDIYFADSLNNVVRRIDGTTGFITTVAGYCIANGTSCTVAAAAGDGTPATNSSVAIDAPYDVALDQHGNLFIAEGSTGSAGRIRVVYAASTLPGIASPVVGDIYTYAGGASGTTPAQLASFQFAYGVAIDPEGYLYVTDYRNGSTAGSNKIWRVDPTNGNIAAIAGNGGSALTSGNHCNGGSTGPTASDTKGDGCPATQAYLNTPQEAFAFDAHGNSYIADRTNNVVRSFTYNNTFPATTVGSSITQPLAFLYAAGSLPISETFTTQGSTTTDYTDGGGDTCALNTALTAATTCINYVNFTPSAAGQRSGSITVASATATVATQTLSGVGSAPLLTVTPATAVTLGSALQPLSVSTDQSGNVNISDGKSKQVLRTTIAGATPATYITSLGMPRQTSTDPYGNVFVADSVNSTIVERTAAGNTLSFGTGLSAPQGVVTDQFGNIYVADTGNNRLLYISPLTGNQRTVALSGYTLSAPTYLALDSNGDLFIIDTGDTRVLEIPLGSPAQLVTLPTGASPVAIAFDPAGDTYIADKTTGSILFLPVGSTTATSLITGLTVPAGVAVGSNGNLFVADSSATSVTGYNVALNTSTFTTTNINLTSLPVTLTLGSIGNVAAILSTPTYTETGSSTVFPSNGTPTCVAALALVPGSTCTQSFVFSPTTPATETAKAIFTSTTAQSITANFSAIATNLIPTSTTITPLNATTNYGQTTTYTVTLTPKSTGSASPIGTIAFIIDGNTVSTQNVSTSSYTFTAFLAVGIHSVSAVYSGDVNYAGSNASTLLTVSKAITSTVSSYTQGASGITIATVVTPGSIGSIAPTGNIVIYVDGAATSTQPYGTGTVSTTLLVADGAHTFYAAYAGDSNYIGSQSTTQSFTLSRISTVTALITPAGTSGFILTAKVTGTTGTGIPSGSIIFSVGSTVLATVPLTNGIATYTTPTLTYASYSFSAAYSGDGLYQPSTSTGAGDFFVTVPITTLGVPQGGQAIESITVIPINGYSGSLTAACSNLPSNAICRFLPTPLTVTAPTPAVLTVQVFAGVNPNVADTTNLHFKATSQAWFALLLAPIALALNRRRSHKQDRKSHNIPWLLVLVVLTMLPMMLTGCGLKTPAAASGSYSTPAGTTTVTLTLTDTNKISRSAIFNIIVSQ